MDSKLLFIAGDKAGCGKSTICLALLSGFLKNGYKPSEIAYVKPCTQCEDVQLIWKFCEKEGITCEGVGPIRFYQGFTKEIIDGKDDTGVAGRHERVLSFVTKVAKGKKIVVVDGVGYPSVGSIAGVSNAQVAKLLNAAVVVVGRPGVGDAIDSMDMITSYFNAAGVTVLGAIWNKIPALSTYHTFDDCVRYVTQYFKTRYHQPFSPYGFIPVIDNGDPSSSSVSKAEEAPKACVLRPSKESLKMNEADQRKCDALLAGTAKAIDIETLLKDLGNFASNGSQSLQSSISSLSSASFESTTNAPTNPVSISTLVPTVKNKRKRTQS